MSHRKKQPGKAAKNNIKKRRNLGIIYGIVAVLVIIIIAVLYHYQRNYGLGGIGLVGLFAGIYLVKKFSDTVEKRKA